MWPRLEAHDYDLTGFIHFGSAHTAVTLPPPEARIEGTNGYDGQWFWLVALDPTLGDPQAEMLHYTGEYRAQRIAYPALAAIFAGGDNDLIPWTLLVVNIAAVLTATALGAMWAQRWGHSPYWGLVLGLTPGVVLGTLRDLSDPLAATALAAGLVAWRLNRRLAAALLLTLAVLSRETMLIGVVAVALDVGIQLYRAPTRGQRAAILRESWFVLALPTIAFLSWQTYATVRLGVLPAFATPEGQFGSGGLLDMVDRANDDPDRRGRVWDLAYIGLIFATAGLAFRAVLRRRSAMTVTAALFSLVVLLQSYGDRFSYTRASAPLLFCLTLNALETDDRWALRVTAAAAALVLLVP